MTRQIVIEFEKGGRFVANLMDDMAPNTCNAIWNKLPIVNAQCEHGKYSGEIFFFFTPQIRSDDLENPKWMGLYPGDILWNPHFLHKLHLTPARKVPQEICIVYGGCLPADECGQTPFNLFSRIVEGDLEELARIGMRLRREGFEKISFKKK
jgi:hypothetical protein